MLVALTSSCVPVCVRLCMCVCVCQVLLKKVELHGIGVVRVRELSLQVQCTRCGGAIVANLTAVNPPRDAPAASPRPPGRPQQETADS